MSIIITSALYGSVTIIGPSVLTEELIQIQTDQYSIDGSLQRNRLGQKKQSTMEFTNLAPSDYQTMINLFTTGSGVFYNNNQSNYAGGTLTFSGMPSFSESQYVQGGSLYRQFKSVIREL